MLLKIKSNWGGVNLSERKKLFLLDPREYEHQYDRKALNTLKKTPGLEKLTKAYDEYYIEKACRVSCTGSYLRITDTNYPDIYQLLEETCTNLYLKEIPELYLKWDHDVNIETIGYEKPIILLSSRALDILSTEELLYVIGHEIGHIKSGHKLYDEMFETFPTLFGTFGITKMMLDGLERGIRIWSIMSDLTGDRAGFLACQDEKAVISGLIKISGANQKNLNQNITDEFIKQAKEFKIYDYDFLDKIIKSVTIKWQDNPWTLLRASEIINWIDSGAYHELIHQHKELTDQPGKEIEEIRCPNCGAKIKREENFCGECGIKLWSGKR